MSRAFGIIIKFSFNLLSDVAYAITSFSNTPKPSVVGWVDVKLPTCKAACDTTNFKPSNVKLASPFIAELDGVPVIILSLPALPYDVIPAFEPVEPLVPVIPCAPLEPVLPDGPVIP